MATSPSKEVKAPPHDGTPRCRFVVEDKIRAHRPRPCSFVFSAPHQMLDEQRVDSFSPGFYQYEVVDEGSQFVERQKRFEDKFIRFISRRRVGLLVDLLDLAVLLEPLFIPDVLQVELREIFYYSLGLADGEAVRAAEALVPVLRYFYASQSFLGHGPLGLWSRRVSGHGAVAVAVVTFCWWRYASTAFSSDLDLSTALYYASDATTATPAAEIASGCAPSSMRPSRPTFTNRFAF